MKEILCMQSKLLVSFHDIKVYTAFNNAKFYCEHLFLLFIMINSFCTRKREATPRYMTVNHQGKNISTMGTVTFLGGGT